MIQIEIDLFDLYKAQAEGKSSGRPGLVKKKVTVKRGGKTFQQYRWVKSGVEEPTEEKKPVEEEPTPKPKGPVIVGLNKPVPEEEPKLKPEPELAPTPKPEPEIEEKGFAHKLKVGDMVDVGGGTVHEVVSVNKENRSLSIGAKGGNAFNYDFDLLNVMGKELSEEDQYAFSGFAHKLKVGDVVTFMAEDMVVGEVNTKEQSVKLDGEEYNFVEINEVGKFKSRGEETFIEVPKDPPKEDQMGLLKDNVVPSWGKMPKTMRLPKSTEKHFAKMMDMTTSKGREIYTLWGVGNDTIVPGKIGVGEETTCSIESHNGKWSRHHTHPEGGILSFSPADIWGVAAKVEVDPNNISTMQDERTKMMWVAVPSTETLDVVKGTHHLKVQEKYHGKYAEEQSELWLKHKEGSEEHAQATRQVIGRMAKRLKIKLYHGMPGEELKQYDGKW